MADEQRKALCTFQLFHEPTTGFYSIVFECPASWWEEGLIPFLLTKLDRWVRND